MRVKKNFHFFTNFSIIFFLLIVENCMWGRTCGSATLPFSLLSFIVLFFLLLCVSLNLISLASSCWLFDFNILFFQQTTFDTLSKWVCRRYISVHFKQKLSINSLLDLFAEVWGQLIKNEILSYDQLLVFSCNWVIDKLVESFQIEIRLNWPPRAKSNDSS